MTTTTAPRRGRPAARTGDAVAGAGTLLLLALRLDRVRIPVWLAALTLGSVVPAVTFPQLYPTAAARRAAGETMRSPAGLAFTGPEHYLSDYSIGSMVGHQMLGFMAIMVGLMSVLMVARHTRTEEETGRAELVRSGAVGRHAPLAAALTLTLAVNLALALLLTVGLGALGPAETTWEGSLLYGLAHAAVGLTFAGVAAVTVQVTEHSRGASAMALAVVGAAYLVRAAGDSTGSGLSWASPIGWVQRTYVFLDDRWWPLLANLVVAAGLVATGLALGARRDVGAGLRSARPGRPTPTRMLTTPLGFALRLHRGLVIGFAIGMLVLGASYGPFLGDIEEMVSDIEVLREAMARQGGAGFVHSFVAMVATILAIVAAIHAVLATLRARTEETAGRAEPVLATGLSRTRWLGSHLAVALVGGPVMLLLGGFALAATGAPTIDESGLFGRILLACAAYTPALWVTTGVTAVLVGWFPRASGLAWLVVVYAGVVGYLGAILQFPAWMQNLSVFGHVPRIPVEDFTWTPPLILTALAIGLVALGLMGFRRRDVETR